MDQAVTHLKGVPYLLPISDYLWQTQSIIDEGCYLVSPKLLILIQSIHSAHEVAQFAIGCGAKEHYRPTDGPFEVYGCYQQTN